MPKWEYGGAYKRHPISPGEVAVFENGSKVAVHNLFEPLPDFVQADLMFVDPPWNLGNLNTFYTKANRTDRQDSFETFYKRLFECIGYIRPRACYVEVGKEYLSEFIQEMKSLFPAVTFYNSSYYHRQQNICYVVRGGPKRRKLPLDYIDEADIIAWVCENEDYDCIADICMGQGLVGIQAMKNGRRFIGTDLNGRRLSVLLEVLAKDGHKYRMEEKECRTRQSM